jgi:hypothetical protein
MKTFAVLTALLTLLAACGKSRSSPTEPSPPTPLLTGEYTGTERASFGTTSLHASFVQSGTAVTGSYSNGRGDAGTVTGTVSGTTFSGTLRSTRILGFTCDVSAVILNGGASLEGTFACSDGTSGSFTLNRV